jgi:hypothetical protein
MNKLVICIANAISPRKLPSKSKTTAMMDPLCNVTVLHIRPRVKFALQIRVGEKSEIPRDGPHNDQLLQCNPLVEAF